MSKEIQTDISIEGKSIKHFSSVMIAQQFNAHHTFQLIVDHEEFEELGNHGIENSKECIGKRITISFGEKSTDDNIFKGVITEVGMQHSQGLWGHIVIQGYSPTFLMEGGHHNDSYYKKSLDTIAKNITDKLSIHDMKISIKPAYTTTLDYTCQYNESHFHFLNRLSSEYGEWFYYNGEELFFGKPEKMSKIELLYGEHVDDMSFTMRVVPAKIMHYSYNSSENKVNRANSPSGTDVSNEYVSLAVKTADELFKNPVSQSPLIRTADKQQLDRYAKKQKGMQAASTVLLTAHGDNPKVKLGCNINLRIVQKEIKGKEQDQGEYLITSVSHHLTGTGVYSHTFEAIPSENNYIPVTVEKPTAEIQMAIVKDNNDPEKAGRVRVQMLWQEKKGEMTDWIRVLTPDAGSSDTVNKNRGFVFIPEVDDQVLVGFRNNDANRPFVLGSMFHGKIAEGGGTENNSKTIQTRSGHRVELNDQLGAETITITDKNKNSFVIDTVDNSITITANGSINMNATDINMIAKGMITMNAGAAIEGAAGTMVTFGAAKSTSLISGVDTVIMAGKMLSASGGKNAKLSSGAGANIELQAKGKAELSSSKTMDIKSKESTMSGTKKATFKSTKTLIEGTSKAIVKGSKVDIS